MKKKKNEQLSRPLMGQDLDVGDLYQNVDRQDNTVYVMCYHHAMALTGPKKGKTFPISGTFLFTLVERIHGKIHVDWREKSVQVRPMKSEEIPF